MEMLITYLKARQKRIAIVLAKTRKNNIQVQSSWRFETSEDLKGQLKEINKILDMINFYCPKPKALTSMETR